MRPVNVALALTTANGNDALQLAGSALGVWNDSP